MITHIYGDTIAYFFSRLTLLTNHMKSCCDKITKMKKVLKVLRVLIVKI